MRSEGGSSVTLQVNCRVVNSFSFPVPDSEIEADTRYKLEQNPGYRAALLFRKAFLQ